MKKYNYIIGIFLIILGCLSGIILDTLGFILAILGIVLVLLSKQKSLDKITHYFSSSYNLSLRNVYFYIF
ncbi:hypothetical protein QIU19_10440 [Capnocytophaga canimorsus]|nr:hypothetical protein [Capnocytophaga canimorsus]WGU67838.1 hypothetical protein QIU19_10440 [Capnocytophaga canimorsus]